MILYPAIDLKDGNAVRLFKGDMGKATVFNENPAAQAQEFADAGCEWIHLVDLNGAFAGEPVNGAAVDAILETVNVPCQLGGGIRDMATIERWINKGLARVILGTMQGGVAPVGFTHPTATNTISDIGPNDMSGHSVSHYLTAPKVSPCTNCFWQNQPKTTIGPTAAVETADNRPKNRPSGARLPSINFDRVAASVVVNRTVQ